MFVDRVAESDRASDCDSEDLAEAGEAGVVAFGVLWGGRFVGYWLLLIAGAGGEGEGASRGDGGSEGFRWKGGD